MTDSSRTETRGREPLAGLECFHCGLAVPAGARWRCELLGMTRDFCCAGCLAVAEAIRDGGLDGYYALRTSPAVKAPEDAGGPERVFDREEIQAAFVRAVGPHREARLLLEDIRCDACLWLNERRLAAVPGVVEASVGYADHCARVRWDPEQVKLSEILAAVRSIGYRARPVDPSHRGGIDAEIRHRSLQRLLFSGVLGMMVMNLALAAYFAGGPDASGRLQLWEVFARWVELAASAALLAYPGQEFFAAAWRDLAHRRAGMDVPIALGLAATWTGSAWATLRGGPVYFDAVAMLVFFVLLARSIQTRARLTAASSIDRFAVVAPALARRVVEGGGVEEVSALDLVAGDVVRIGPGETAPADGAVIEGRSTVEEAVLTGEPWPRRRGPGDEIAEGSVNGEGALLVRVTRAGGDSALGGIRRLVERGLAARPAVAELADRLAGWLVAAVLICAAGTAAFWAFRDPTRLLPTTVAVLIVTCPCALALATPVVLTLAAGRLARIGVLPLRLSALEPLARAEVAVFDKTGTLTTGAPRLESIETFGLDRGAALAIAAALEEGSRHPVGRALRGACAAATCAEGLLPDPEGRGAEGRLGGARWWIGSPSYALAAAAAPEPLDRALSEARGAGALTALLADRGGRAALFRFTETPRQGSEGLAAALRREGVRRLVLLSGDSAAAARRAAQNLGFDEGVGALRPSDKLAWIEGLRGSSGPVLFVGDGWNDAPTLAAADVSVAVGDAVEASRLSSDFVILGKDLSELAAARRIARLALRLLRQNVAWALAYNICIVPAAAAGLVPPWMAALAMSASSIAVVANALRLTGNGGPARGRESVHAVEAQPELVGEAGNAR